MKKRARRVAVLAFTILFAGSVFTATALAEQPVDNPTPPTYDDPDAGSAATGAPIEPEPDPSEPAPSQSGSSMTSSTGSASTNESTMNSSASASSSESSGNNNSGGTSNSSTSTEDPPSTPNRDPDIQVSTPSHITNPDTQQGLVNSRANALGSTDPEEQSNTDWSELLGGATSDTSEASSATASSGTVSSEGQKASSGGVTWMLILGILFILLALAGIGYFVYAQFFAGRGGPKNGGPNGTGGFNGDEDETDFVDISSSSDGLQHREGYLPPEKNDVQQPGTQSAALNDHTVEIPSLNDETPIEEIVSAASDASRQPPLRNPHATYTDPHPVPQNSVALGSAARPVDVSLSPKAQATPVEHKNFDWDKFFEENSDI